VGQSEFISFLGATVPHSGVRRSEILSGLRQRPNSILYPHLRVRI
jgi:hypothetical protein